MKLSMHQVRNVIDNKKVITKLKVQSLYTNTNKKSRAPTLFFHVKDE